MVGPGSIGGIPIALSETFDSLLSIFRAGPTQRGLIVPGRDGPQLQLAGNRMPLPSGTGLETGQAVEVTLTETEEGPVLRVRPKQSARSPQPSGVTAGKEKIIGTVLKAIDALSTSKAKNAQSSVKSSVQSSVQSSVKSELPKQASLPKQSSPAHRMSSAPSTTERLIGAVLKALDAASPSNVANATPILPKGVALPEAAMRALFTLHTALEGPGEPLARVALLLEEAVKAGALEPEAADDVIELARVLKGASEETFARALKMVRARLGRPVEAEIVAALLTNGDSEIAEAVDKSLLGRLIALKSDERLSAFLRGTGQQVAFHEAVDVIVEFVRGGQLQNLHALETPYHFLDLPLHPDTGIQRAQIHIFGQGGHSGSDPASGFATIVLDLHLTRLGDLWIELRETGNGCDCRLEAVDPEVVLALETAAPDLAESLRDVGYANVFIEAGPWAGDRLEAAGALFQRLSGLDVSA